MFTDSGSVRAYQHMRHMAAARAREERQFQEQTKRASFYARTLSRVGGWLVALGCSLQKCCGHLASAPLCQA
jgi:hypothetical protein